MLLWKTPCKAFFSVTLGFAPVPWPFPGKKTRLSFCQFPFAGPDTYLSQEFRGISGNFGRSAYPQKPASNTPENFGERSERISGNFGEFLGVSGNFGEFRGMSGNCGEFRGIPRKLASNISGNFGEVFVPTKTCFKRPRVFRGKVPENFGEFRGISGNFGEFRGVSGNFGQFRAVSGGLSTHKNLLQTPQGTSEKVSGNFGEFRGISGNPTKTCFKRPRDFRGISGRSANPQKPCFKILREFRGKVSGNFGQFRGISGYPRKPASNAPGNFGEFRGSSGQPAKRWNAELGLRNLLNLCKHLPL